MLRRDFAELDCSVARALEIVGERWTLLVLREAFLGVRRFEQMQADLGIARNVLAARLDRLVEHGLMERRPYQERPVRHEYRLTDQGRGFWPVLVTLMQWGDEYAPSPKGAPMTISHRGCGGAVDAHLRCAQCGAEMGPHTSSALRRDDLAER